MATDELAASIPTDIRRARPDEWEVLQRLNNQVFENDQDHDEDLDIGWPFSSAGIAYYKKLADGSYGACFIACKGEDPVGYIALAIKDFGYRKNKHVEVENIGVDPVCRSRGVGRQLIEHAAAWARQQGAAKLYVSAYWKNTRAIKFYRQNGFEALGLELERRV